MTTDFIPSAHRPDFDRLPVETNMEQRTPCVLLLDTSGSMGGEPIAELNAGLQVFQQELLQDPKAARRVEVALVTFGERVQPVYGEFVTARDFQAPSLAASGATPMGEALSCALELLQRRRAYLESQGIPKTLPWMFLITDGAPTDQWQHAARRLQQATAEKQLSFFAIGVQGADMTMLAQLDPPRPPAALRGLQFHEFFKWLSSSLQGASRSRPGTAIAVQPIDHWGTVNT